jgi:hypothetical protein
MLLFQVTEKYCFPIDNRSFIETSCSNDSYDLLLSSNHEYALEDISYSHMVQDQYNHVDFFTSGEEINMKEIPLLSQQSIFNLEEENHHEEECVDCETVPSVDHTISQSSNDIFKEDEIPFRELLSTIFLCSREAFMSLNSSTYLYLYHDLFNGLDCGKPPTIQLK